ncbi:hypothetical protein [Clostridium beijerinckii]|nr:hypothetical protein [Clostridium beijerinckii]
MVTLVQGDMEGCPYYDQLMEFIGKRQGVERQNFLKQILLYF